MCHLEHCSLWWSEMCPFIQKKKGKKAVSWNLGLNQKGFPIFFFGFLNTRHLLEWTKRVWICSSLEPKHSGENTPDDSGRTGINQQRCFHKGERNHWYPTEPFHRALTQGESVRVWTKLKSAGVFPPWEVSPRCSKRCPSGFHNTAPLPTGDTSPKSLFFPYFAQVYLKNKQKKAVPLSLQRPTLALETDWGLQHLRTTLSCFVLVPFFNSNLAWTVTAGALVNLI